MSRRRNRHPGVTDLAWRYLTDTVTDEDRADKESWELTLLDSDHRDYETGYTCREIWQQYRDEVLAHWVRRHPGTRPWCWWRFESGLNNVQQIYPIRPLEIIEDARSRDYTYWCLGWHPDTQERLTDAELEVQRSRFVMDQRAWLEQHGHLLPGE